jgi:hypothetical protein
MYDLCRLLAMMEAQAKDEDTSDPLWFEIHQLKHALEIDDEFARSLLWEAALVGIEAREMVDIANRLFLMPRILKQIANTKE